MGILLLAVATIEADGLLMCVSYVATLLITLLFGYAPWLASNLLTDIFRENSWLFRLFPFYGN